jgi:hypothetical protein
MSSRRSPAAWAAVLGWCALAGWIAFVRDTRVPLLSLVDLGFHELGHLIMYGIPINDVLTAAMGSINQCAVPCGLAAYFWFWRRDGVGACTCLAWAATNFQDASVYIADAPYQRLELLGGGMHDWAFVLGPDHLNQLQNAHTIAATVRGVGLVCLCVAVLFAFRGLLSSFDKTERLDPRLAAVRDQLVTEARLRNSQSSASSPVAATATRSDDLFPNT